MFIALLRRLHRLCARRWHSLVPIWRCFLPIWLKMESRKDKYCENDAAISKQANNFDFARLCVFSALLAIPPFIFFLFISGLSDHFFAIPFEQFHWSSDDGINVNVAEEVIRELLGKPSANLNLRPLNPWNGVPPPLIEPDCAQNWLTRKRSILIVVKSAPHRREQRDAIRANFGSLRHFLPEKSVKDGGGGSAFRLRTVFVLGRPAGVEEGERRLFDEEAAKHKDMLVGDFTDSYFNNTLKFVHSIRFARHHCDSANSVPFLLLLDDDYVLFPQNLVAEIQKHVPNERLYVGWRMDTTPFRFRLFKWAVSLADYPFSAYPPYITAGAVLLSGQTVSEFYAAIPHVRLYKMDDVYTGILAYLLAIHPQHNAAFAFHRPASVPLAQLIAAHGYAPAELRDVYTTVTATEEN